MINSRDVNALDLAARRVCIAHVQGCRNAGIELLITSTYRDAESQNALYAIGRTKDIHRRVVTNARGGQSWHQYKASWDCVPIVGGKCVWDAEDPLWVEVIKIGKSVGAEAAADWKGSLRELAHFQVRPEPTFTLAQALDRFKEMGTIFL